MGTGDIAWSDLELFLAIDQSGSLSGAGRRLGVEQSTVSRRLSELERRIGRALFVRSREGVIPTPLGVSWRGPARVAEEGVLQARRATAERAGDIVSGEVRVASLLIVADLFLTPVLPALFERYPDLRVCVEASSHVADLNRLEADIAIRLFRPKTGDLIARSFLSSRLVALAAPSLIEKHKGRPINTWPWITWSSRRLMHPQEGAWLDSEGIVPRATFLSPTTIISAARAGVGVALLGEGLSLMFPNALEQVAIPTLPPLAVTFWLVVHRKMRHVPRIDAVWRWLIETAEQLQAEGIRLKELQA